MREITKSRKFLSLAFAALVLMSVSCVFVPSVSAEPYSTSWYQAKPSDSYKLYNSEIGNGQLGDWGGVTLGANVIDYVDHGTYCTITARFTASAQVKVDLRNLPPDIDGYPGEEAQHYFVKYIILDFNKIENPTKSEIFTHHYGARNLRVEPGAINGDLAKDGATASTIAQNVMKTFGEKIIGPILTGVELAKFLLERAYPLADSRLVARYADSSARVVFVGGDLYHWYEASWQPFLHGTFPVPDVHVVEASGYTDITWNVDYGVTTHALEIKATAGFGWVANPWCEGKKEVQTSVSMTFRLPIPPYVSITSPSQGQSYETQVPGGSVAIPITVFAYSWQPTLWPLTSVEVRCSDGSSVFATYDYYSLRYYATLYLPTAYPSTSQRQYTLTAIARDTAGKESSSSPITIYVKYSGSGGGGGGCPYLLVYDGSEYINEGLLDIHTGYNGTDLVTAHVLTTSPAVTDYTYHLSLVEHWQTISHIDQVKLYARLSDGRTILLPLVSAIHSQFGNVLPQLLRSDDWRVDELGAKWNNGTSQSIELRFLALPPWVHVVSFIFVIEGFNRIVKYY